MSAPTATKEISSAVVSTLDEPVQDTLLTLDKTLASQTQTYLAPASWGKLTFSSAQLNIAYRSLDELTTYAKSRLEGARKTFKKGLQEAGELQKELADLERRVRALRDKTRERWPVEYYTVRDGMET